MKIRACCFLLIMIFAGASQAAAAWNAGISSVGFGNTAAKAGLGQDAKPNAVLRNLGDPGIFRIKLEVFKQGSSSPVYTKTSQTPEIGTNQVFSDTGIWSPPDAGPYLVKATAQSIHGDTFNGNATYPSPRSSSYVQFPLPAYNAGISYADFLNKTVKVGSGSNAQPRATLINLADKGIFQVKLEVLKSGSSVPVYTYTTQTTELATGQTFSYTGTWSPPDTAAYYVRGTAMSIHGSVFSGNSTYPSPRTGSSLVFPSQPDFTSAITAVRGSPVLAGGNLYADAIVSNIDFGSAGSSVARFYLSTNSSLSSDDVHLGYVNVPSVNGKANHNLANVTLPIPQGTPAGSYCLLFYPDADKTVSETNEGNNLSYQCGLTVAPTYNAGISYADFLDKAVKVGTGSNAQPRATLVNLADRGTFQVKLEVLKSGSSVPVYTYTTQTTELTTGQSFSYTGTWSPPDTAVYYVRSTAMSIHGSVFSGNSTYPSPRTGSSLVFPSQPDFTSAITAVRGSPVVAGGNLYADAIVSNIDFGNAGASVARFYLSTDSSLSSDDISLGSINLPSINGKANHNLTNVTLPIPLSTLAGSYCLLFYPDSNETVVEANDNNNVSYECGLTVAPTYNAGISFADFLDKTVKAGSGSNAQPRVTLINLADKGIFQIKLEVLKSGSSVPVYTYTTQTTELTTGQTFSYTGTWSPPDTATYYVRGTAMSIHGQPFSGSSTYTGIYQGSGSTFPAPSYYAAITELGFKKPDVNRGMGNDAQPYARLLNQGDSPQELSIRIEVIDQFANAIMVSELLECGVVPVGASCEQTIEWVPLSSHNKTYTVRAYALNEEEKPTEPLQGSGSVNPAVALGENRFFLPDSEYLITEGDITYSVPVRFNPDTPLTYDTFYAKVDGAVVGPEPYVAARLYSASQVMAQLLEYPHDEYRNVARESFEHIKGYLANVGQASITAGKASILSSSLAGAGTGAVMCWWAGPGAAACGIAGGLVGLTATVLSEAMETKRDLDQFHAQVVYINGILSHAESDFTSFERVRSGISRNLPTAVSDLINAIRSVDLARKYFKTVVIKTEEVAGINLDSGLARIAKAGVLGALDGPTGWAVVQSIDTVYTWVKDGPPANGEQLLAQLLVEIRSSTELVDPFGGNVISAYAEEFSRRGWGITTEPQAIEMVVTGEKGSDGRYKFTAHVDGLTIKDIEAFLFYFGDGQIFFSRQEGGYAAVPVAWHDYDFPGEYHVKAYVFAMDGRSVSDLLAVEVVPPIHTVTAAVTGTGGSITPSSQPVQQGSSAVFTVSAASGYQVDSATGCGGVLVGNIYTTAAISAACTVSVSFIPSLPPVNRPPTAQNGSFSVTPGESIQGVLSASDPDGDPLTYSIVSNGAQGAAVILNQNTGLFIYTADSSAAGSDSFNFRVNDGSLDSTLATVTVSFLSPSGYWPPLPHTLLSASFNGQVKIDSTTRGETVLPAAASEVGVFAGNDLLCGRSFIEEDGSYSVIVYGDDPVTPEIEGAVAGETLTFRIWDSQRQKALPARTLQPNGSRQPVTWSDNGGGTVDLHGLAQQQIGVFRKMADGSSRWYADADGNGQWGGLDFSMSGFGLATDKIASGDWNGDGLLDPGVFRSVNGQGWWYFDTNGSGVWESGIDQALQFGLGTDIPVVGDWNGDGKSDFGVFRNVNGLGWWYFDSNGNRAWDPGVDDALQFGLGTDIPVVGDWNGDGQSDFGVFRVINGQGWWFFDTDGNRRWDSSIDQKLQFGLAGDLPVAGDWNGDGRSDFGVMRNGVWYLDGNGNRAWDSGVDLTFPSFGIPGDQPMGGVWR